MIIDAQEVVNIGERGLLCLRLSPVSASSVTALYHLHQEGHVGIIHGLFLDFHHLTCCHLRVGYACVSGQVGLCLCNWVPSVDSCNHTPIKTQNPPVPADPFPTLSPTVPPRLLPVTWGLSHGIHDSLLHLQNAVILRMSYTGNHTFCHLRGWLFSFALYRALESHSCCCVYP